jgi:hypothetical protein
VLPATIYKQKSELRAKGTKNMSKRIIHSNNNNDGIDRRGFPEWVGTGVFYTMSGGVLRSETIGRTLSDAVSSRKGPTGGFTFVQISDSHIDERPGAAGDKAEGPPRTLS